MSNKARIAHNYFKYKNVYRFKTRQDIENYQNKGMQRLIKHLNKHSAYYHDLLGDSKALSKEQLDNQELLQTLPIVKQDIKKKTIGARDSNNVTEENVVAIRSHKEIDTRNGMMLARLLPQLPKSSKIAFFQRNTSHLNENIKSKKVELIYFDIDEPIKDHITLLSRLQADVLIAPPSILLVLADAIYNKRLSIEPKKIIAVDEVLEDTDRDYLIKEFKVKTIGQMYLSSKAFIGYTCEHGTLHINEDLMVMEEEKIDEDRFIPIITDFTNLSNPVVRYRLNDILVHKKEPCPCGCPFMALEKIEGLEQDVFIFTREDKSQVKIFPDTIRQSMTCVEGIKNYEVIQKSQKALQINLEYDQRNMFALSQNKLVEQKIIEEFKKVARKSEFHELEIVFDEYKHRTNKKMKRVKRVDS